ncbi:MAG: polyprenyl synthetase family protein [Bacteroidales bacterium]|jgi:octaprenyl-diphosphate synthase|nr:polyprenyl synthetase family protein [Bacteroidales bacterium]
MNKDLTQITKCIKDELNIFEKCFEDIFNDDYPFLNNILSYNYSQKGKHIRPILSILIAKTYGDVTENTYRACVILELLHTASLLHDDVIDDSNKRRDKETINSKYGDKTAILLGDYLYGKCLSIIKTQEDFNLIPIYAKVGLNLPKGEIKEKIFSEKLDSKIESYLSMIDDKTVALIEAATKIGGLTCKNSDIDISVVGDFGVNIGRAFQIKDDILDYSIDNKLDKEVGNDIKEKKITIPLIYYLDSLNKNDREDVLKFIAEDDKRQQDINDLIVKVSNSQAMKKVEDILNSYSNKAIENINLMPNNIYSETLKDLVQYLIYRNK